jgi:hypothetical protein
MECFGRNYLLLFQIFCFLFAQLFNNYYCNVKESNLARYWGNFGVIAGFIQPSLQLHAQVTSANLGWCHMWKESAKWCDRTSTYFWVRAVDVLTYQLQSRDWGRRTVRCVQPACKSNLQNDRNFVDVLLQYLKYTNMDGQRRSRNFRRFLVIDGHVSCVMHCNSSGCRRDRGMPLGVNAVSTTKNYLQLF